MACFLFVPHTTFCFSSFPQTSVLFLGHLTCILWKLLKHSLTGRSSDAAGKSCRGLCSLLLNLPVCFSRAKHEEWKQEKEGQWLRFRCMRGGVGSVSTGGSAEQILMFWKMFGPDGGGGLVQFISNVQSRYFGHVARRDSNCLVNKCVLGMKEGHRSR